MYGILVRPGALGSPQLRKKNQWNKYKNHFMKCRGIGMVNQQKGVQQETVYSAVVVNDPRPYIVFGPKGVIET